MGSCAIFVFPKKEASHTYSCAPVLKSDPQNKQENDTGQSKL